MNLWEITEKTDEQIELKDPDGWYEASIRRNGCVELKKVHNIPFPFTNEFPQSLDHIHFCDLDKAIDRLKELKEKAVKVFGNDWG